MNKKILGVIIGLLGYNYINTDAISRKYANLKFISHISIARQIAIKQNKKIIIYFSGSDWCGWSKKFEREILMDKSFYSIQENFVLVNCDFPKSSKQPVEQIKHNTKLAQIYEIKGYPSVVICEADGTLIGQTGYISGGGLNYVKHIKKISKVY
jgi:thioredoxin-related protein